MKTQKEIERIAESKYKYSGDVYIAEIVQTKRVHFTKGYAQCQKDMAEKKYTEEDIRKAISESQRSWVCFPNHNSFEDAQVEFMYNADEIIELLNKQE